VLGAVGASTIVIVAALILAGGLRHPPLRVPNVVTLREDVARAEIQHSLPSATVTVRRVYSTRVAAGRVIGQRPLPRTLLLDGSSIRLVVSRGTPFARVPEVTGSAASGARASLARYGFTSRYAFEHSWRVRKGSVVELQPRPGTLLRRPASVTIVVASGYPRSVVPDVRDSDLGAAEEQLAARHLRFRLVYRLDLSVPPGRVLDQLPAAGTSVYQGARIRLAVARGQHWVKLFAASGTEQYESAPFTVPARWRIRYRLTPNDLGFALARLDWFANGDDFSSGGFLAAKPDSLFSYVPSDGAGQYRLTINPYAGTRWFVQVEVLE
jgi:beta-lactam-binding protein with PASTA domain